MLTLMCCGAGVYFKHGIPSRLPAEVLKYSESRSHRAFLNEISQEQAAAGQFAELGGQSTNAPVVILLWGDSHAMAVAPVLDKLCRQFSVRGVEATHSSTAPILDFSNGRFEKALAFSQSVVSFIIQKHIKIVIIAADWSTYHPPGVVKAKLAATIEAIMASGTKVYLLKDVPKVAFDVPTQAAMTAFRHGDFARLASSVDQYAADNHNYDLIFNQLSRLGASVLDTPRCFLNSSGRYDVVRDGNVLYSDGQHLTVEGSQLLSPMLEPLFHKLN